MRRLRKMRRPSTSMIVACLALVLAMGGTAVAVVGLNGKQKKQVKKISKNQANKRIAALAPGLSVLHSKTADTATRAESAAKVDQLKTGGFQLVASSASAGDPDSARAAASEVPLFSIGAFDVYGKCFRDTGASATYAETYIRTRVNGSILDSDEDLFSGNPFLDTGTAENARQLSQRSQATGSAGIDADDNGTFGAAAPDGTAITGQVAAAVKNGTLAGGDGIYGAGDKCVFWGHLIG
jgi:hypothetical protein